MFLYSLRHQSSPCQLPKHYGSTVLYGLVAKVLLYDDDPIYYHFCSHFHCVMLIDSPDFELYILTNAIFTILSFNLALGFWSLSLHLQPF